MLNYISRNQQSSETSEVMKISAPINDDKAGEDGLVILAQQGDLPAFNQLVALYEQRIFNLAYRLLGDRESAADATQDTFFQAYRALAQYRGGSFKSWLLRIVTNISYDRLRTRRRRPTSSLDELVNEAEEIGGSAIALLEDVDSDPSDKYLQRETMDELSRALDKLPPEQKLVIVLSDVQGMSYEEIATITRTSLGTVKSRLNRGRTKIRELLQNTELLSRNRRL
ncbi:sigma-70 family RNA polymerase sigma factor [Candidatus Chlorohelix sp.]|uniref:RNA polymerase sigma factor n=1 Tax=Candidatus Chlorohelix sp. TaxID=3139201 RepID=UPI00304F58D0